VNDLEEVVGEMLVAGYWHAFMWSEIKGVVDLGALEGGLNSSALAINNSSVVVGCADVAGIGHATCTDFSGNTWHAVIWEPSKSIRDLGTFGGPYSVAYGINSCGYVVGQADVSPGVSRAFLYSDQSGMKNLGTVAGSSYAHAINDSGLIVGTSNFAPFLYDETGMHLIAPQGTALSINSQGEIVAQRQRPDGENTAFLYRDGTWTDLKTYIPKGAEWRDFLLPMAINDRGSIIGQGYLRGVDPARAFFMTPIDR
jgi:probable HAF family extracellular repeat protein